jgi:ubiquinone/menaquinone biosynthesis C-methylase UbiE
MSYWYQTKEVYSREDIKTMLDIGPGSDFLKNILAVHCPQVTYETLDIAEDLHPDHVGSATVIPLPDNSYDVVSAFQVLEHIEFKDFEPALREMSRVSKKYVFISLPHNVPTFDFQFKLPGFKRFSFALKIPWGRTHTFNGQHYWEIGKKGYELNKIKGIFKKHFTILEEYVPYENQYHHFFILEKK